MIVNFGRMSGKDLQDAYNEGYVDALTELESKVEKELTKASWYSKGSLIGLVKNFKEGGKDEKM